MSFVFYHKTMTTREIFKANLKYYRKQKKITQEKLAERIGCNPKYITEIESRAKFPSAETIDALAHALGISVSDLFMENGCPQNIAQFASDVFTEKVTLELFEKLKVEMKNYLETVF